MFFVLQQYQHVLESVMPMVKLIRYFLWYDYLGKNVSFYQQPGVFVKVIWIPKAKFEPLMTKQCQSRAVNDCIIM